MDFKIAFFFVIALHCVVHNEAMKGIDFSQPTSTEALTCLKQKGYDFAIVRAYRSTGTPDTNAPQSIENARKALFTTVEAYMFPCTKCGNAQKQVSDMLSLKLDVDWIWLDIETSGSWYTNTTKNREFFEDLINADFGKKNVGVYTNKHNWETIMGLTYTRGSSYPLWYAHYDGKPSFEDFEPFSGWSKPQKKQYAGDQMLCGAGLDFDYQEEEFLTF